MISLLYTISALIKYFTHIPDVQFIGKNFGVTTGYKISQSFNGWSDMQSNGVE